MRCITGKSAVFSNNGFEDDELFQNALKRVEAVLTRNVALAYDVAALYKVNARLCHRLCHRGRGAAALLMVTLTNTPIPLQECAATIFRAESEVLEELEVCFPALFWYRLNGAGWDIFGLVHWNATTTLTPVSDNAYIGQRSDTRQVQGSHQHDQRRIGYSCQVRG